MFWWRDGETEKTLYWGDKRVQSGTGGCTELLLAGSLPSEASRKGNGERRNDYIIHVCILKIIIAISPLKTLLARRKRLYSNEHLFMEFAVIGSERELLNRMWGCLSHQVCNDYVQMCGAGLSTGKIILPGRQLFSSESGLECLAQASKIAGLQRPSQTTQFSCLTSETGKRRRSTRRHPLKAVQGSRWQLILPLLYSSYSFIPGDGICDVPFSTAISSSFYVERLVS